VYSISSLNYYWHGGSPSFHACSNVRGEEDNVLGDASVSLAITLWLIIKRQKTYICGVKLEYLRREFARCDVDKPEIHQ